MQTEVKKPRLLIDFDRVIHKYSRSYQDGSIYDEPVEGAIEALKSLQKDFDVMVFTAFSKRGAARNMDITRWLERHGVYGIPVTNIKHDAAAFIDDKAIRFTDWNTTLKLIEVLT